MSALIETLDEITRQRDQAIRILGLALSTPARRRLEELEAGKPKAIEAIERGLVGALFVDASLLPACEKLKPSDFALPDCARIFGAVTARAKATGRVELVLVANDLGDPDLSPATAPSWLVACSRLLDESLADEDSVGLYVAAIRDAAIQRRVERRRA